MSKIQNTRYIDVWIREAPWYLHVTFPRKDNHTSPYFDQKLNSLDPKFEQSRLCRIAVNREQHWVHLKEESPERWHLVQCP